MRMVNSTQNLKINLNYKYLTDPLTSAAVARSQSKCAPTS